MGNIRVDGLGVVEIAGDEPTPDEVAAISRALSGKAGETYAAQEQQRAAGGPEAPASQRPLLPEGRTGLVSPETRASVRETVEAQPGAVGFLAEMTPAKVGTAVGGALGTAIPPHGAFTIPGAMAGGLLGEFLGQEVGITPESNFALGASAAGPVAGPAAGAVLRWVRKGVGMGVTGLPAAASAAARTAEREAVAEFDSLGGQILTGRGGGTARPASELYKLAREAGAVIPVDRLQNTARALTELTDEASKVAAFPEAKQALAVLENVKETLSQQGTSLDLDTLVRARQLVGAAVDRFLNAGGITLGSAKKVFRSISDDLDALATEPTKAGAAAGTFLQATARAKLEFSVRDFEAAVARFTSDIPGEGAAKLNVAGLQKWLRDISNPKHADFDKNFTTALDAHLSAIKQRLSDLAKITEVGGPAGPGSIVVRNIGARTGAGVAGFFVGGPVGAGVGALFGARIPEGITAVLMSQRGSALLKRFARMGKGDVHAERWAVIGQVVGQGMLERRTPSVEQQVP